MNIYLGESGSDYIYTVNRGDTYWDFSTSYGETPTYRMMDGFAYPNTFTFGELDVDGSGFMTIYRSGETSPLAYLYPYLEEVDLENENHTEPIRLSLSQAQSGVSVAPHRILHRGIRLQ